MKKEDVIPKKRSHNEIVKKCRKVPIKDEQGNR